MQLLSRYLSMDTRSGASLHTDFDALLRAQPGSCTSVEYCPGLGLHGGVLSLRSVPDARSNSTNAVKQWWTQNAHGPQMSLEPCPPGSVIPGHILSRVSPSGKFTAVFRKAEVKGKSKTISILEIRACAGVVLARTEMDKTHGDVLSPSWFGGACWSEDEQCLYYTAEAKRAEPSHFWDTAVSATANTPQAQPAAQDKPIADAPQGNVYDFIDDWGEQNTGTASPCVFRVEPWSGAAPVQVPVDVALGGRMGWGQPLVTPDNKWLIVTAWADHPRRLGSIYCMQRPSGVYAVSLEAWLASMRSQEHSAAAVEACVCRAVLLSSGEVQARSARLSPCGGKLVFLGRDGHAAPGDAVAAAPQEPGILRTHNGAFALRGFAMGAWQAAGCPCTPCPGAGGAPLSDSSAPADGVQYKQGLLPVKECADGAFLSTLVPIVDDPGVAAREDRPIPSMGGHESAFPGLYTVMLPRGAWSSDGSCVALHSAWFSRTVGMVLKVDAAPRDGGAVQLQVCGAVTSLSPGTQGLASPQGVLKQALQQVGAVAVVPPATPGALSPTAVRQAAHTSYLSVTTHGWAGEAMLAQVHCPVAGSYLATATVDWASSSMQFKAHTSLMHRHMEDLVAAQHARQLCAASRPAAAEVAGSRTPLQAAVALAHLSWKVLRLTPLHKADVGFVEGILVLPPHDTPRPAAGYPLIVMPHGGPHGAYPTVQFHSVCLFALAGYAVVTVNYRGSTGFGERALAALPGDCGTMDVLDCVDTAATVAQLPPGDGLQWTDAEALQHFHAASGACVECGLPDREAFLAACETGGGLAGPVDCQRISVIGGSHGGFLATHLVGQFPSVFRAAVARNPVIDISQMVGVTDIPDWCWVEALGIGAPQGGYDYSTFTTPAADVLARMRACSPIEHVQNVQAAVLLTTGAKDRRVPPSQSVLYYHSLRALGKTCRMQWYPEDCHPLSSASTDADALVHMLLWLQEHAGSKPAKGASAQ